MSRAKLTNELVDHRLRNTYRRIIRLEEYINAHTRILWGCEICNNQWSATPGTILNDLTGCPKCAKIPRLTNKIVDSRLIDDKRNIKRIGQYIDSKTKIDWKCTVCNNQWKAAPDGVLNSKRGCSKCSNNLKLTNKIVNERLINQKRDIQRIGQVSGTNTKIDWKCNNGHVWKATPNNVLNKNTGCSKCNRLGNPGKLYFKNNPHKKISPGLLYLIEITYNNQTFIKVGITEKSVKNRFLGDIKRYNIIELTSKKMSLYEAYLIEQKILRQYIKYLVEPNSTFNGKTECMQIDQNNIQNIINTYF